MKLLPEYQWYLNCVYGKCPFLKKNHNISSVSSLVNIILVHVGCSNGNFWSDWQTIWLTNSIIMVWGKILHLVLNQWYYLRSNEKKLLLQEIIAISSHLPRLKWILIPIYNFIIIYRVLLTVVPWVNKSFFIFSWKRSFINNLQYDKRSAYQKKRRDKLGNAIF